MFLKPGMQVPVSQLIRGINLQSGNDACVAMADFAAGSRCVCGPDEQLRFCAGPEKQPLPDRSRPGCGGSVQLCARYGADWPALIRDVPNEYAIYKEKEFTFNGIRQTNRNGLLWDNSLNVDGIKTGHTDKAGYNWSPLLPKVRCA